MPAAASAPSTGSTASAPSAAATAPSAPPDNAANAVNAVDMEDDSAIIPPSVVAQGLSFQDEQFVSYLAPVAVPTLMQVDMGDGHVPTVAYCSGFAPPASIGGEAWMAWFQFLKSQEDGLPFVINGLRWHSHNCARAHFQTNSASGVNDECEKLEHTGAAFVQRHPEVCNSCVF